MIYENSGVIKCSVLFTAEVQMGKNKDYKDTELWILTSPHIPSVDNYVIARKERADTLPWDWTGTTQGKFWQFLSKGR